MVKQIFEIHAAGVDSTRITAEIEKDLLDAGFDPAEVRQVQELSFAPVSPAGDGGFDPALTAELFERPVAIPDFRSRKYRFIRGPLRSLAGGLFRLLVQVDEKLSENKVLSFYHVVHELISLSHRFEKLQAQFSLLQEERLREKAVAANGSGSPPAAFRPTADQLPVPPSETARRNERLSAELAALLASGSALVLDDAWGHFAAALQKSGFSVECAQADYFRARATGDARGFASHAADCNTALLSVAPGRLDLVALVELERLSGEPEFLPELLASRVAPGGIVALRWTAPGSGPFLTSSHCSVNRTELVQLMTSLHFNTLVNREEDSGSFELILRREA